jgi:hypothetical protein
MKLWNRQTGTTLSLLRRKAARRYLPAGYTVWIEENSCCAGELRVM